MDSEIQDNVLLDHLISHYGLKKVIMYNLRKAKKAADRARIDIAGQNQESFIANTQIMIDNIDTMFKALAPDERKLPTETKSKKSS